MVCAVAHTGYATIQEVTCHKTTAEIIAFCPGLVMLHSNTLRCFVTSRVHTITHFELTAVAVDVASVFM